MPYRVSVNRSGKDAATGSASIEGTAVLLSPIASNDLERVAKLRSYCVLDTAAEPVFDRLTELAQQVIGTPIVMVALIDTDRQWVKSRVGTDVTEVPRSVTFCGHAVYLREMLLVPDARQDPRFADNPFVVGPFGLRFYLGIPLMTDDGFVLGTLCCVDTEPRPAPSAEQLSALNKLADAVVETLEQRLNLMQARAALKANMDACERLPGVRYRCTVPLSGEPRLQVLTGGIAAMLGAPGPDSSIDAAQVLAHLRHPQEPEPEVYRATAQPWSRIFPVVEEGRTFWLNAVARPHALPGGSVVWEGLIHRSIPTGPMQERYDGATREALDAMPDAILVFDADDRLKMYNRRAADVFSPILSDALIGTSFEYVARLAIETGVLPPVEALPVEDAVRARIANHRRQASFADRRTARGTWLRCTETRMSDGGIVCAYTDITDLKLGERELEQKTRLLQAVLNGVEAGVAAFDAENRLMAWNETFLALLGIPQGVVHRGLKAAQLEAFDDELPTQQQQLLDRSGRAQELQRDILRDDGRIVEMTCTRLAEGGFVATYTDVTAARGRAQELQMRALFDELLAKVSSIANQSAGTQEAVAGILQLLCSYTGCDVGQSYLRPPRGDGLKAGPGVWDGAEDDSFRALLQQPLTVSDANGDSIPGLALSERQLAIAPDLWVVPCERAEAACAAGLRSGFAFPILVGSEVEGLIECYAREPAPLTGAQSAALKYTAAQLSRLAEREQSQRLKNEFVSTVSHELRTPLTSIRGSLGLLLGPLGELLKGHPRNLVEIAHRNAERLISLVNDILDIEKIEAGALEFKMAPLALPALLAEAVEANASFASDRGVKLVLHPGQADTAAPTVVGDSQRLLQVMSNLLSNAAKFSPEGGTVEVSLRLDGGQAEVTVRDHGSGIPAEFQKRIFSKFAQADSSDTRGKNGTGLGLSISRSIVERHGGSIRFESVPGDTRFIFTVPLQKAAPLPAPALQPALPPAAAAAGEVLEFEPDEQQLRRVLVCEDDADIGALLSALVQRDGFAVDIAEDAASARRLLEANTYAAMTLDLKLPDEDGMALLQSLRAQERFANLPAVVVSAHLTEQDSGPQEAGVVDWLAKPIDPARLHRALLRVPHAPNSAPSILHVEDDADLSVLVQRMLDGKASLTSVGTVAEARRLLRGRRFDLVIVDLTLSDGSGLDLLADIGERGPPMLVFSAAEAPPEVAARLAGTMVKSRTSESELVRRISELIRPGAATVPPERLS